MTLKWNCRKSGCYLEMVLPDWAMLDGCFGATKVKASDIDGYIHQNGSVLFLEKKFPNGWLDEPQIRAINTLVKQGNSFIVIWCERSDGSDISLMRVFGVDGFDWQNRQAANLQDFRSAVQQWWQRAYKPGSV